MENCFHFHLPVLSLPSFRPSASRRLSALALFDQSPEADSAAAAAAAAEKRHVSRHCILKSQLSPFRGGLM